MFPVEKSMQVTENTKYLLMDVLNSTCLMTEIYLQLQDYLKFKLEN